jgi:hypothetical protein
MTPKPQIFIREDFEEPKGIISLTAAKILSNLPILGILNILSKINFHQAYRNG